MEKIGIMVPFLKAFVFWHLIGFIFLLLGSFYVYKITRKKLN